jgi:hypothetical protein
MPDLEQQISAWRSQMLAAGIQSPVPLDELETHLRDEIQRLIQSGLAEEKAFLIATNSLGDGRALRSEFSKVNRHWFWIHRNNPLPLKILAASFIIAGLDPLVTAARFSVGALFLHDNLGFTAALPVFVIFWGFLQVLIGQGLLRRSNAWRRVTFVWSGLILFAVVSSSVWAALHTNSPLVHVGAPEKTDILLGIEVPFMFSFSLYLLHLAIMAAGLYILNQPSIRALFRREPKTI